MQILMSKRDTDRIADSTLGVSKLYVETFHHERAPILSYLRNLSEYERKMYYFHTTKPEREPYRDRM